jgi:hypothetical protein
MFDQKYKIITVLSIFAFFMNACGSAAQTQENISTSVAQTVQAQNSLTKVAAVPTLTPEPSIEIFTTANPAITNTTAPVVGAPGCTVSARLASENPPDQALLKPGDTFLKTWSLENTGTCTWDTSYKLVFMKGDLMDGLASYPLPEPVAPGETKDISIYLKAPDTSGAATGYWSIKTPWNTYFGAGAASDPFYVQVVVSSDATPVYGITSVTYNMVRDPDTGCPTNVRYHVYATITTNGPYTFEYYWDQKDGNFSKHMNMTFDAAGSQTISRTWVVGKGDSPSPRWMQIIVTSPVQKGYDKFVWPNNCP